MLIGVVLLSACHTTRHTVSEVGVKQDEQSSHQEQTTTQRLDSLFSKLSVSADSITIDLYDSAPTALPQADSLAANPNAQAQPATAKPARKGHITIHQPRIPSRFLVSRCTLDTAMSTVLSLTGLSPSPRTAG